MNITQNNYPVPGEFVRQLLTRKAPENWQKTGFTREYYLDIVERIVRNGIDWVDENGAVIDPVILIEYYQSSSRFVSACAVLLYHGRCMEYKEKIFRVMDHCCDCLYRPDSAYSLLAGSFFALAALFSDDTIAEAPAVSEIGGYSFQITNSFYKGFCNQASNYLEFDLRPDPAYDACGLGRILMKDLPWGLLPVMGFAREENYCIAPEFSPNQYATAIAPEWDDKNAIHRRMADYSAAPSAAHLSKGPETLLQEDIKELEPGVWQISYEMWEAKVIYTADLHKENQVLLTIHISGDVQNAAMIVPVLKFDGSNRPQTELSGSGFTSLMSGKTLICTTNGQKADFSGTAVNRTGVYDRIRIRFSGSELKLVLQVR